MNQDPAFTQARVEALNAVDLRLIGVTHGITRYDDDLPHVEGGNAEDFDRLMDAASELRPERGDVMAVEPVGFSSPWAEDMTLANMIPATIPEIPVADMGPGLRGEIVAFLEMGRQRLHLNNLVYTAAHTLLRGVPVHRAEVSRDDYQALLEQLRELPAAHDEIGLFYRNTKMLARLGDIAIDMGASRQANATTKDDKPILLFQSGRTHTPRMGERLTANGVRFTTSL